MRQVPWIRTRASALVMVLIFSACLLMCVTPLMSYGLMFLYFASPCLLCLAWLLSGRAAADVCLALAAASFYFCGGAYAALAGAVYLFPAHFVFRFMTVRGDPALKTGIAMGASLLFSQLALYVWAQASLGGKAYEAAANAARAWFEGDRELGDMLLIYLNYSGMLPLSSSYSGQGLSMAGMLTASAREDLLNGLQLRIITYLSALVPAMLVEMSIYQGAVTVLIPRRAAERYIHRRAGMEWGEKPVLPGEDTPQLRTWHLPRGWGWKIGILGAGYFLIGSSNVTLSLLGKLMFYAFFAIYSIQGVAFLNHIQCMRGRRRIWRIVIPLLILMLFQEAMCLMGCADQILDIRRLRTKNNDEHDQWEV
ncbi:MAG: DUF2232 domain-containing protein [Clostridia bacterium]|nr:DUF2232 domain-containing protein [Clostridia bacterium]